MRAICFGHRHQFVPGFVAVMWHVYNGCGIIRAQFNILSGCQGANAFAQLQNRQRAQQAGGVYVIRNIHACDIVALLHPVHKDVTIGDVTPGYELIMSNPCSDSRSLTQALHLPWRLPCLPGSSPF